MTVHVHSPSAQGESGPPDPRTRSGGATRATRPGWLLPGLAVGIIASALVAAGVLSLSTVLYAGLLGGMILMHAGGHGGHGNHGSHGSARDAGRDTTAIDAEDLRERSSGSQPRGSASDGEGSTIEPRPTALEARRTTMTSTTHTAATDRGRRQPAATATDTGHGHPPASRIPGPSCAHVVLADFGKSAPVPTGAVVPIEFMPDNPGEHAFTCQVGMLPVRIIVEAA